MTEFHLLPTNRGPKILHQTKRVISYRNSAPVLSLDMKPYVQIRYEPAYQDTLTWLFEEFTELRGCCTVNENGDYYSY